MSVDELTILRALDTAPVPARGELQGALRERLLTELQVGSSPRQRLDLARLRMGVRRVAIATAMVAVAVAGVLAVLEVRGRLAVPEPTIVEQPPAVEPTEPSEPSESPRGVPTDALGIVLDARARWLAAPRPLHAGTVTDRVEEDGRTSVIRTEVWLLDESAWRTASATESSDGTSYASTTVWDGERELGLGDWVEGRPSAQLTRYQSTGRHPFGTPLRDWVGSAHGWERRCAAGEVLTDAEVAGRPARHVRCGPEELWLDTETGLLLRHERPAGVDDHDPAEQSFTVTAVTYDPDLPEERFSTEPPVDRPLNEFSEMPTPLGPGDAAPPFEGRTVDGELVDLRGLRGQHVLVVFWSPGLFDLGAVEDVHRSGHDGLAILVLDTSGSAVETAAHVADRGYSVPIVFDDVLPSDGSFGAVAQAWLSAGDEPSAGRMRLAQSWVLIGPDGDVVETRTGNFLPEELEAWLADTAGVAD